MPKSTPATLALRKLGVAFKLHSYIYDSTIPSGGIGLQAAEALGIEPSRVLKTLMAEVDGLPVCVVVPSDSEVSMKKLAARSAANREHDAPGRCRADHRLSCRRHLAVRAEEEGAGGDRTGGAEQMTVFVNGGQRGLQIELDPNDAAIAAGAHAHALTA